MVKAIAFLTDEQRAQMPAWAAKWIDIGLSTEPMDLARFEPAARACYRYAGLAEPRVVVPVSSPMVLALAAPIASAILANLTPTGRLKKRPVEDAVRDAVGDAVRGAVGDAVGGAVRGAVGDAVEDAVGGAVGGLPESALRRAIARAWYYHIGGQFWVGWGWWWGGPSTVSFLRDVCGLTLPGDLMERAIAYQETTESACWWWPHKQFVMVSDRPMRISRDERGRLHSESGPAIVWRDGWGVYAWHGVRVPANVIDTPAEKITAKWINDERNAEIRRVLVERVGAERYLALAGSKVVATDDWGTLHEIRQPVPMRVVELVNSTPEPDGTSKRYFIRMPETAERLEPDRCITCGADLAVIPRTPLEAVAWSYRSCPPDYSRLAVQS